MGLVFIVAVLWVPEGLVGLAARVRGRGAPAGPGGAAG